MPAEVSLPGMVESGCLDVSGDDGRIERQFHTRGEGTEAGTGEAGGVGETGEAGESGTTATATATATATGATATATAPESLPVKDVMMALSPSPSRNRLARSHFRSRSLAEVPRVPPMTRAYSSPGLDSRGRYIFGNGRGTSMSAGSKENGMANGTSDLESKMTPLTISEPIAEHAEPDLESGAQVSTSTLPQQQQQQYQQHHTFPRMGRRRPSSPLHVYPGNNVGSQAMGSPTLSSKYNEAFPAYSSSSASSIPSTPTSLRSRSPSISSLETIPDIPDAEAAASEDDQVAALKAAADREDDGVSRRRTHDVSGPIPRFGRAKRWSVCGAERRQDLDLETIWED